MGSVKNIYVVKEFDVIFGDGILNFLVKVYYKYGKYIWIFIINIWMI